MARNPILEVREVQNIILPNLIDELTYDPSQPRRYYTSNIVNKVLSIPLVFDGTLFRIARGTSAGFQKVVTSGSGFDNNDTKIGNAPDAYSTAIAFDSIAQRVDFFIFDKAVKVKRTKDGITWNDEFEIPANSVFSVDVSTHSFNIENETAGQIARFSVIGWW